MSDDRYFTQSLAKGLRVLEAIARSGGAAVLTDIAQRAGVPTSTAHRLLYTLEVERYVERLPGSKEYRLRPEVLGLGFAFFQASDLWQTAHPRLVKASKQYGETFNLAVLDGAEILYIDRVKTRRILSINLEIGSKLPAYCTSMGRVLLASLPDDEVVRILARSSRSKFTPYTKAEVEEILAVLAEVRQRGYAVNDGELAVELRSVAAPVRDGTGKTVAAVNLAVHASEYSSEDMHIRLAPVVMRVADEISLALGYRPLQAGPVENP